MQLEWIGVFCLRISYLAVTSLSADTDVVILRSHPKSNMGRSEKFLFATFCHSPLELGISIFRLLCMLCCPQLNLLNHYWLFREQYVVFFKVLARMSPFQKARYQKFVTHTDTHMVKYHEDTYKSKTLSLFAFHFEGYLGKIKKL